MTAIFAFVSTKKKSAFLGADSLDGHSKTRHDKVVVLNRFVVASYGVSVPLDAARATCIYGDTPTRFCDDRPFASPNDTESFAESVASILPRVADRQWRAFKAAQARGERTTEQEQELESLNGSLVILDKVARQLSLVAFGKVFPAKTKYEPRVKPFPPDRGFRFAIDDPLDLGELTPEAIDHPFKWCTTRLSEAITFLDSKNMRDVLGDLGACYYLRHGREEFRSAHASYDEALDRFYPPVSQALVEGSA